MAHAPSESLGQRSGTFGETGRVRLRAWLGPRASRPGSSRIPHPLGALPARGIGLPRPPGQRRHATWRPRGCSHPWLGWARPPAPPSWRPAPVARKHIDGPNSGSGQRHGRARRRRCEAGWALPGSTRSGSRLADTTAVRLRQECLSSRNVVATHRSRRAAGRGRLRRARRPGRGPARHRDGRADHAGRVVVRHPGALPDPGGG